MTDKTKAIDPTAELMNQLSKRLTDARCQAVEQITALGWQKDILFDNKWYEHADIQLPFQNRNSRKIKSYNRALSFRDSIVEIDIALSAMNHFAEDWGTPDGEPDVIIQALEACINAISAFYAPDAEIGRGQRANGKTRAGNKTYVNERRAIHQRWVAEDNRLKAEKPQMSPSRRAELIAKNETRRQGHKPVSVETVRAAIRRCQRKLVSQA